MIGFNTILSLSKETTVERFLEICRLWQRGSPHTTLAIDDRPIQDGLLYTSDQESMEFLLVEVEGGVHCGVRHIRKDVDGEWQTDVVGYKTADHFKVAIVSSRSHFQITTYSSLPLTPYIVGLLIRETGPMFDDDIQITSEAREVTAEHVSEISELMNSSKSNIMPVVYISAPFNPQETYMVNPRLLAQKLAGLAHVYYESDSRVSRMLKNVTDGKNAYNGSIGIYWPDHSFKRFLMSDTDENMIQKIQNYIKRVLNTRRPIDECRWSYVQSLKYQRAIGQYLEGAEENHQFIDYALQENRMLMEQIQNLEAEVFYLREQQRKLLSNEIEEQKPLIFKGKEIELFDNEQAEIIIELIEDKIRTGNVSMRMRNMLMSILEANERTSNKEVYLTQLKKVLTEPGGLSKQGKRDLVKLGFNLTEDGKHYKLEIKGDGRYSHPIAKTPSDFRSQENNFSQLKRHLF